MQGVVNRVAGGRRSLTRKLWHIAGSKRRCWFGRRRRNVYDKKPLRYAKDNRTAHLTACSDKSIAYVTNNKRLYSTFCTVEANYWQIRSIARPLCDSRATCSYHEVGVIGALLFRYTITIFKQIEKNHTYKHTHEWKLQKKICPVNWH